MRAAASIKKALAGLVYAISVVVLAAVAADPAAAAAAEGSGPAAALHATYDRLRSELASSPFKRPLLLESNEADKTLRGDVYAVVEQPFAVLAPALQSTGQWCDLLILHLNVKSCRPGAVASDATIALVVGRKVDQALSDAYQIDFRYLVAVSSNEVLRVQMNAPAGPLGTTDYRLAFEAVPLDSGRSFVHLSYAYAYGLAARMATQTYLSTLGRDKVGFSVVSKRSEGEPVYVDGVRGVLERNTMRYYLAIEAYLEALGSPPVQQPEKRLLGWFAATERYPRQLHEIESSDYLTMKRSEIRRQQAPAGSTPP